MILFYIKRVYSLFGLTVMFVNSMEIKFPGFTSIVFVKAFVALIKFILEIINIDKLLVILG